MKTRVFESYGIYISIVFVRNLDREPAWRFVIENVEDVLFESGKYSEYPKCELESLKKAVEFL